MCFALLGIQSELRIDGMQANETICTPMQVPMPKTYGDSGNQSQGARLLLCVQLGHCMLFGSVQVGVANSAGLNPLHLACQFGHCGMGQRVLLVAGAS